VHKQRDANARGLAELARSATAAMRDANVRGGIEYLPAATTSRLIAALEACSNHGRRRGLAPGAPALKLAQVIDLYVGADFVHAFRGVTELAPGGPLPMTPLALDHVAEGDARDPPIGATVAATDGGADWIDRVAYLRLAPEIVRSVRVRLKWSAPWLDPLTADTRLAAVVTNRVVREDFAWREYQREGEHVFYGVSPKDPSLQRRRVQEGVRAAQANGATVIVLPELTFTTALRDELETIDAFAAIPLMVAGSAHVDVDAEAPGRNVARVYAHGMRLHEHRKLSRSSYVRPDGTPCREHLEADESDGPDLLIAPGCTAMVLIGHDVQNRLLTRLVEELAPTLVLVPAMADVISDVERALGSLSNCPGFSLFSCAGTDRGAVLGRPRQSGSLPSAAPTPTPCVVVFGLDGSHTKTDLE
jgi:hypothetical protein